MPELFKGIIQINLTLSICRISICHIYIICPSTHQKGLSIAEFQKWKQWLLLVVRSGDSQEMKIKMPNHFWPKDSWNIWTLLKWKCEVSIWELIHASLNEYFSNIFWFNLIVMSSSSTYNQGFFFPKLNTITGRHSGYCGKANSTQ